MAIRDLPDMYALSPRALGIHISGFGHTYVGLWVYISGTSLMPMLQLLRVY